MQDEGMEQDGSDEFGEGNEEEENVVGTLGGMDIAVYEFGRVGSHRFVLLSLCVVC